MSVDIALSGYSARQWRKRVDAGCERMVSFALLPRDVQLEVRSLEKYFRCAHSALAVLHLPAGPVLVRAEF